MYHLKFSTARISFELKCGPNPQTMISEDLAYRIYKMILDGRGTSLPADVKAIFPDAAPKANGIDETSDGRRVGAEAAE